MDVMIDSVVFEGTNLDLIAYKDAITAIKESPLRPKHHVASSLFSVIPAMVGPMMRARLN